MEWLSTPLHREWETAVRVVLPSSRVPLTLIPVLFLSSFSLDGLAVMFLLDMYIPLVLTDQY